MAKIVRAVIKCYRRTTDWCNDCPAHTAYIDAGKGWSIELTKSGWLEIELDGVKREIPPNQIICLWTE